MDGEDFKFETSCSFCGKTFEPHPDSYWETGVEVMEANEENMEWIEEHAIDPRDHEGISEAKIDSIAMEQLVQAKPGDFIETGAISVCDECAQKDAKELGEVM